MKNTTMDQISKIESYWQKNVPQIWYSNKEPFSLSWFNEIGAKRYQVYYPYLKHHAEFDSHGGEEVLEIGTGMGTDLVEFQKHGARVTGIDLGQTQINLTALNFKIRSMPVPKLKVSNAENLDFKSETFDYIYSFGVLHHTPNIQKAIQEIYRVLKSDGHATIMLYSRGWKHYIKRCFIQGIIKGKYFKYKSWQKVYDYASEVNGNSPLTRVFTRREINELFAGFPVVEVEKLRLGEFFDYKPYGTFEFPKVITNIFKILNLEAKIGENYIIKIYKKPKLNQASISDVIFKHY